MRISTNTIFDKGAARMGELQTGLARTQQQVATGKRILAPSEDPIASARALDVTNQQEINAKYAINRRTAKDTLSSAEGALQSVTSLLHDVKTLIVQAGGGGLDSTQRQYIATELQGRFDELLGLANSTDGVGNYIFSGYKSGTQPFTASATGATYSGDQGQTKVQVHTARQIDVTENGFELFENIKSKGTYNPPVHGGTPPLSSATISAGTVVDAGQLTGAPYEIRFSAGAPVDYSVVRTDTSEVVVPSTPYATGTPIEFGGMQYTISDGGGATPSPQAGETFTIQPVKQSVFATLKNLITTLQNPASTPAERTALTNGLGVANSNIDNALDHVLTARASIGSSLKEIESLDSLGEDLNLQYAQTLSELQDLDYVQAITDLTKQQTSLQAAQQSYIKVTSLSLFNYMR